MDSLALGLVRRWRLIGYFLTHLLPHLPRWPWQERDEEVRIRRVAKGIALEVKKFWGKIERLVLYKHHSSIEVSLSSMAIAASPP